MKLQKDTPYIGKNHAFPADNISQSEKNKPEYYLNCANAILAKYVNNKCAVPYTWGEDSYSIEDLRKHLQGRNSTNKFRKALSRKAPDGRMITNMNISWEAPQIIAQKMDVVKGYIMKLVYDVTTQAIDMQAKFDKEMIEANLKLMIDDRMKIFGVELNEAAGRNVIPEQQGQDVPFQSEKEIAMFSQIGGILLQQEIAIKILLDETLMVSDWEGIKDKLVEDLLAIGWCSTKSYVDKGCDTPKRRWVDMNRAICPYSDYNDHRDASFGAEIRQMTIAEVRKESNLSNEEIIKIAREYSKDEKSPQYMANFFHQASMGYTNGGFGMNMIDSLVVDVVDAVWIGTKSESYTKITRKKEGNLAVNKVDDDKELSEYEKKNGKEKNTYSRQCLYKAKLIVGTSHVFDYGEEYNQTYRKNDQGKMEIMLPYRFIKTGSVSMVERAIPFYEDAAMATFKKRNAIKKIIPPPGLYLEKTAFESVEIGGNKLGPKENMATLGDSGYAVGDSQNVWGQNVTGRNPLSQIPTGSIEQITIFNNEIEYNIRQIERVTGINDIFSGATPSSETGLGVSKIAVNATTNAIYPLIRALETNHEQALRVEAKQWQVSSTTMDDKNRDKKAHDRALGYIYVGKDLSMRDFLIKIEAGVTEEEKLQLLNDIRQLQDLRRQSGSGGIRPSDYLMIYEMIKAGNIKQARLVLAQVEEFIQKMDDARNQQNQQFNIESQMQSNQQTAENETKIIETEETLKLQREIQLEQLKIQGDLMKQKQKGIDDRKLAAVQNTYGWSSDNYNKRIAS